MYSIVSTVFYILMCQNKYTILFLIADICSVTFSQYLCQNNTIFNLWSAVFETDFTPHHP
jgi:hypothetical protein